MRIVKQIGILCCCLLCAACAFFLMLSPVFPQGERYELYKEASSSVPCLETTSPVLEKLRLGKIAGESVRYEGDRVEELISMFRARLLFKEEVCGVENFYLYSPYLGEGVVLNGVHVNLHLSRDGEKTAAGTPLIFGGF